MANRIKVKQSSVPGKAPATTDLLLGELAVNTYDGKLFLKKNVSGTETIVDVTGSGGAGATGSVGEIQVSDGSGGLSKVGITATYSSTQERRILRSSNPNGYAYFEIAGSDKSTSMASWVGTYSDIGDAAEMGVESSGKPYWYISEIYGGNANSIQVYAPRVTGGTSYKLTLPPNAGSSGQVLTTNGTGVLSWTTTSGGAGTTGATGPTGPGVAAGGTTGQFLKKNSSTDYDTAWADAATLGANTFTGTQTMPNVSVSGQATMPLQTLTDAASIAWNTANGAKAKVTLGGFRSMAAVTNAVEGTSYTLWVVQDSTGSRTLSWTTTGAGSFDFGTDGAPTLTTTANAADVLGFEAISIGGTLKLRFCGIKKGFA